MKDGLNNSSMYTCTLDTSEALLTFHIEIYPPYIFSCYVFCYAFIVTSMFSGYTVYYHSRCL